MKNIDDFMNSKESKKMLALLGERAEKISKIPKVKQKAFAIFQESGIEAAKSYVYMLAIGTLTFTEEEVMQFQRQKEQGE